MHPVCFPFFFDLLFLFKLVSDTHGFVNQKVLDRLNDKPFQKRNGSRKTIYEMEEKPYLKTLPMLPFEICE